jgi:hypothetical protein
VLERIERQISDRKPAPAPQAKPDGESQGKAERRAQDRGYQMLKGDALNGLTKTISVAGSAKQAEFYIKLQKRVDFLLTKEDRGPLGQPSWADRVLAALFTCRLDKARGTAELLEVCRDSVAVFGDFMADKAPPLRFT